MRIREYAPADVDALQRMHAKQGFAYPSPNPGDPEFVSKIVLEDDGGAPVMATLARLTCEMYLLADPAAGTPCERYARILALHGAVSTDLYKRGLSDAHAWLPPQIAARFGRRLETMGWTRDDQWTPYSIRFGLLKKL